MIYAQINIYAKDYYDPSLTMTWYDMTYNHVWHDT